MKIRSCPNSLLEDTARNTVMSAFWHPFSQVFWYVYSLYFVVDIHNIILFRTFWTKMKGIMVRHYLCGQCRSINQVKIQDEFKNRIGTTLYPVLCSFVFSLSFPSTDPELRCSVRFSYWIPV